MFLKIIKNVGIWGYIAFGVLALMFIFGETSETPGDANPYLVIAVCAISLMLLLFLVVKNVSFLRPMFIALSSLIVMLAIGTTLFSNWWGDFRNSNGPVLGVATVILAFAMAVWARREPRTAGLLILLVSCAPLAGEAILMHSIHWGGSTVALSLPGVIAGGLITIGSARNVAQ